MYISTNVSIYMDIYGEIVPPTKRVSPRWRFFGLTIPLVLSSAPTAFRIFRWRNGVKRISSLTPPKEPMSCCCYLLNDTKKNWRFFVFFFLNSQANYFQHLCNYIYNMQIYHTSPLHREKNKSKNKQTNKQTMPGEPPEWTKTPVNLVDLMTPLGRLMQSDFPIFQEFPERWFPGRFLEPSESMCQIWSKPYENNRNLQLSILFDIIMFES